MDASVRKKALVRTRLASYVPVKMHSVLSIIRKRLDLILPQGGLEGWLWVSMLTWALAKIRQHWQAIDPISKAMTLLYFDTLHDQEDDAHTWLEKWWEDSNKFKDRAHVSLTKTNVREDDDSLPIEDPASKQEELSMLVQDMGYKSFPLTGDTLWIVHGRVIFRLQKTLYVSNTGPNARFINVKNNAIRVRCFSPSRGAYIRFLAEAKRRYEESKPPLVSINIFNGYKAGLWDDSITRQRRDLSHVILTAENRELITKNVDEFLASRKWYIERALSWKRGLLLHGPPGCGKTSLVVGFSSHYNMPIYVISLNHHTANDTTVAAAVRAMPPKSILLFEDIDDWCSSRKRELKYEKAARPYRSAYGRPGVGQEGSDDDLDDLDGSGIGSDASGEELDDNDEIPSEDDDSMPPGRPRPPQTSNSVSLSAMLQILDGVEQMDGKLIIMTTNDLKNMDDALIRPGRIDQFIEIRKATQEQACMLFRNFYTAPQGAVPDFESDEISRLAEIWSASILSEEFSIASLQGMLLNYKHTPQEAVDALPAWIQQQRAMVAKKDRKRKALAKAKAKARTKAKAEAKKKAAKSSEA